MKRREKAERIQHMLESLYPETPVPLDHESSFQLLIPVPMSAQTTDLNVNAVTPDLFNQGPTPEKMAALKVEQIQIRIKQGGLAPTKAKNIKRLSELLIERHDGEIPNAFEELEALPGVGNKTAGVVLAQAFGIPAFAVDTHIHRLAQRWGLTSGKNVKQTEIDLKRLFPKKSWNKLHLQIIFYGREYCSARGCDGRVCDICKTCYPNRKKSFKAMKA